MESDSSIESPELRELAEDAGGGEVPMAGEVGRIVARLTPEAAAALNQRFGTTAFQTSITVGTMTVTAKGA